MGATLSGRSLKAGFLRSQTPKETGGRCCWCPFRSQTFQNWFWKKQLTISKASRIERHGGEGTRLKLHLHSSGAAPSPQQVRARPVFPGCYFDSSRWIIWLEKFLLLLPGLVSTFYFLFLRTSEFGWSWNVNQILGLKKKTTWTQLKRNELNVPPMISGSYETRVIFNPLPVTITFTIRMCLQHNNHVHCVTFHWKEGKWKGSTRKVAPFQHKLCFSYCFMVHVTSNQHDIKYQDKD